MVHKKNPPKYWIILLQMMDIIAFFIMRLLKDIMKIRLILLSQV